MQLGAALTVLPVHRAHQEDHLYHQCCGGLPPPVAQGHQDQGSLPQRYVPAQTGILGHKEHREEMDKPFAQLEPDSSTTLY